MKTKKQLIDDGDFDYFKKLRKECYKEGINIADLLGTLDDENLYTCNRMFNSIKQRKRRTLNDIYRWLFAIYNIPVFNDYILLFGTLTFTDRYLYNTSKTTRRRYVSRFLGSVSYEYFANIDFGKKNNREHYHFLALVNKKIDYSLWRYGAIKGQKIYLKDFAKVNNYVMKLNNHSFKDTTHQERLIRDKSGFNAIDINILLNDLPYKKFVVDIRGY